jgi:putative spermidine/putrescine transport system substrate-binding protein
MAFPAVFVSRAWTAEARGLTVCSYGGEYQQAQATAYFKPFEAANPGVTVQQDSPESDAKLKAMVEAGQPTWDLVLVADNFGHDSDAEWLEPIDYTVIDQSQFLEGYSGKYRVGADVEATVLAYRKDKVGSTQPKGLADFFNTAGFPGKRAAWKYASGGIFEAALVADGLPADKLYPIDVPRALKKLDTIKKDLIWWETGAQSQQLLTSGEATLALVWVGRAVAAADSAPVVVDWTQWTTQSGMWVVPKGAPNKDLAMKAIAFFTQPAQQIALTKLLPYGPTNKNAVAGVDARYKGSLPTDHFNSRITVDYAWWAAHSAEVDTAFQEWLLT